MTAIERQAEMFRGRPAASGDRGSTRFVLIVAIAIMLIACAIGRLTFQSGATGWTSADADAAAASLGNQ